MPIPSMVREPPAHGAYRADLQGLEGSMAGRLSVGGISLADGAAGDGPAKWANLASTSERRAETVLVMSLRMAEAEADMSDLRASAEADMSVLREETDDSILDSMDASFSMIEARIWLLASKTGAGDG